MPKKRRLFHVYDRAHDYIGTTLSLKKAITQTTTRERIRGSFYARPVLRPSAEDILLGTGNIILLANNCYVYTTVTEERLQRCKRCGALEPASRTIPDARLCTICYNLPER